MAEEARNEAAGLTTIRQPRVKFARIDDKVRILKPFLFLRVGYPLDRQTVREQYPDEINKLVSAAITAMCGPGVTSIHHHIWCHLERAAIMVIMRREKFGGNERKVYEVEAPEIKGMVCKVVGKRMVQTGIYEGGYYSGGYDGGEWNSPYLSNLKLHCIYSLENLHNLSTMAVDAENCELVCQPR